MQKPLILALAVLIISGCDNKPVEAVSSALEANDETCKDEYIRSLKDVETQQKLSGLCLRQPRFKKSPEVAW